MNSFIEIIGSKEIITPVHHLSSQDVQFYETRPTRNSISNWLLQKILNPVSISKNATENESRLFNVT